jgi:amino acid adenylation domain-containing protein
MTADSNNRPFTEQPAGPNPPEGSLGERLARLTPEQRLLLERRLKGKRSAAPRGIPRRPDGIVPPASFAQELMWFLDQVSLDHAAYNVTRGLRLTGPLDVRALEQALDAVLARHEVLRTTFAMHNGELVQVIAPHAPTPLPILDLSTLAPEDREVEARRILDREGRRPLDLTRDRMQRALLLRIAQDDHLLLLLTHHIASDGWSKGVLYRELGALYQAFRQGLPSPLPALPIQYADYALWQRHQGESEVFQRQLAYWKKQLGAAPALLELPTDRTRPAAQSYQGRRLEIEVPKSLCDRLAVLSQTEHASQFMIFLAAFNALLARWSGQTDLSIGTPIAGRNHKEIEPLIGYFTNTLVLRTDAGGDPTFRELLRRVRGVALEAYDNQDVPFEKLVAELQPHRDLSHTPLFQVLFTLQAPMAFSPDFPGVQVRLLNVDHGTSKFDLGLLLNVKPDGLKGLFEYSTDLFEHATIERLRGRFLHLLEEIARNPDRRLSALPLLSEDEERCLLVEWNQTEMEYPRSASWPELFEARVQQTPEAPAVVFGGQSLSYRELNARADRLGRHLRRLGVGPEVLVGICVERSLEMAVGLVGILKAGGAFVPLDPAYPEDRLRYMIEDAGISVLLTLRRMAGRLPAHGARVVCLDEEIPGGSDPHPDPVPDWNRERERDRDRDGDRDNAGGAAYVIYTSGSTGQPRGAVLTQRGLVNHCLGAIRLYDLRPDDRVLQFSSLSFDIAIEEMFPAWLCGAAVVVRNDDAVLSGAPFLRWLDEHKVTVVDLPTAFWHEWVRDLARLGSPLPPCLRTVIVGGEKASRPALDEWLKITDGRVRWFNTYGPTETTVIATAFGPVTSPRQLEGLGEIPIGRPTFNNRVFLLDKHLQPVAAAVTGELYIGGDGVGRGYLRRPDLTAERFIADPFGSRPGSLLFRTGDRARWRPDGTLEFVARADQQVKVHGFRVEPGEIEAALRQHPDVHDAVVEPNTLASGEKRLAAYVVGSAGATPPGHTEVLREFLRKKLPAYMVPAVFVILESLPLTPNAKVDRAALPAPTPAGSDSADAAAPRTPFEEVLAGIWEEVFGLERVGIHDNFFDLGGHSLRATQVIARIHERLRVDLSLRDLWENPTVAGLALAILLRLQQGEGLYAATVTEAVAPRT